MIEMYVISFLLTTMQIFQLERHSIFVEFSPYHVPFIVYQMFIKRLVCMNRKRF